MSRHKHRLEQCLILIVSDTLGHPQASIDRPDTTFTTGKPFRNKAGGHLIWSAI
jgi:hypothetical protein